MPYYHMDQYNDQIKRKCNCGGEPEQILDFVDDYIVRCKKCHKSTYAYMEPKMAIEHWENLWEKEDNTRPPLDLLIDDLDKNLSGDVLYMAIPGKDAVQYNLQSCDCDRIMIVMKDRILSAQHEPNGEDGTIGFDECSGFNKGLYNLRIASPSDGLFRFMKVVYHEDGTVDAIKYRYGDRYLFIFADEYNLIVTKSINDLTDDEDGTILDDQSILFE